MKQNLRKCLFLAKVADSGDDEFITIHSNFEKSYIGKNTAIIELNSTQASYNSYFRTGNRNTALKLNEMFQNFYLNKEVNINNSAEMENFVPKYLTIPLSDNTLSIYKSVQFHGNQILFLNVDPGMVFEYSKDIKSQFQSCIKSVDKYRDALSNQDAYFCKYHDETEIEYKLNLNNNSDIWYLACIFYDMVKSCKFTGFVPQFLDNFNQWDFDNYLYEVLSPKESQGYISFIRCPDNKYVVKQKKYTQDSLERIEIRTKNVVIDGSMEDYLAINYPNINYKRMSPFNRKRFDINLESLDTGNIFSIMFDKSLPFEKRDRLLSQCEVEYLKSRTVGNCIKVEEELKMVFEFVKRELTKLKIDHKETFYSKLSFLRDIQKNNIIPLCFK